VCDYAYLPTDLAIAVNASDRASAAWEDYYGVNGDLKAVTSESISKVGSRGRLATRGATTC